MNIDPSIDGGWKTISSLQECSSQAQTISWRDVNVNQEPWTSHSILLFMKSHRMWLSHWSAINLPLLFPYHRLPGWSLHHQEWLLSSWDTRQLRVGDAVGGRKGWLGWLHDGSVTETGRRSKPFREGSVKDFWEDFLGVQKNVGKNLPYRMLWLASKFMISNKSRYPKLSAP